MKRNKRLGIVVRYSDSLNDQKVDTIAEHNSIFKSRGSVFVGKFGQPVAKQYMLTCDDPEIEVNLILVTKSPFNRKYLAHIAPIEKVQKERPPMGLSPSYYAKRKDVRCWFKLAAPLTPIRPLDLEKWVVRSSGAPLLQSLAHSMSGLFYAAFANKKENPLSRQNGTKPIGMEGTQGKRALANSLNTSSDFDVDFADLAELPDY